MNNRDDVQALLDLVTEAHPCITRTEIKDNGFVIVTKEDKKGSYQSARNMVETLFPEARVTFSFGGRDNPRYRFMTTGWTF
jgi:hypothetical protein